MKNSFATTNAANSFADTGKSNAWGYSVGGGAEVMVTNKLSLGLEYLYTDLKDNDYRVEAGQGTAPASDPLIGTNIIRDSQSFKKKSDRGTRGNRLRSAGCEKEAAGSAGPATAVRRAEEE